jgi:phosphate transport system substrate-binding protein
MHRRLVLLVPLVAVAVIAAACSSSTTSKKANTTASTAPPSTTVSGPGGPLGPSYDTTTSASVTLNGSGANTIQPFFSKVFYDYNQKNPKTTINYSPAGSSVGVSDMQEGTVNFGDTEVPMSTSDLAKAKSPLLQIPVTLGGVAISYNVPGAPNGLKLDGAVLAGIFDGSITNWNSSQIASVTGDKSLPNLAIVPVHRSDSAGPTWDLDEYFIKTAPDWVTKTGTSTASKTWPLATIGVGEDLNSGVSTYIKQTSGAIGYVGYSYALQSHFTNVAVKNAAGDYVLPTPSSISLAGSQASNLSATNFSVVNEPGKGTYPLANFSWTILYQSQPAANQDIAIATGKLFDYVVTTGQESATALGYSPLPSNVESLAVNTLYQLKTSTGSALFSH